jgi:hydroxyethylthiazole kinase
LIATATAHQHTIPWVLDPVAVGATRYRQTLCSQLLAAKPSVIRGNASEILALSGLASQGRGVDATASTGQAMDAAIALAQQHGCIVAMTGESDWLTDGTQQYCIEGGHPLMPRVTTLGCGLSALVTGFVAANRDDPLGATAAALGCFAVAGKQAGSRAQGPGSFQVALLDTLYHLSPDDLTTHAQLETRHAV